MSDEKKNETAQTQPDAGAAKSAGDGDGLVGPFPYKRPMPNNWWLQRGVYVAFMIREFTALFVGAYAVLLLVMVYKFGQGPAAFNAFLHGFSHPVWYVFHGVALLAAVYHTTTWFNAAPKALVFQIGEEKVPDVLVAAGHYFGWAVATAVLTWFILG